MDALVFLLRRAVDFEKSKKSKLNFVFNCLKLKCLWNLSIKNWELPSKTSRESLFPPPPGITKICRPPWNTPFSLACYCLLPLYSIGCQDLQPRRWYVNRKQCDNYFITVLFHALIFIVFCHTILLFQNERKGAFRNFRENQYTNRIATFMAFRHFSNKL